MDVFVTKKYLAMLFTLWISPIICAIWGGPVWVTISLAAFFLIYAGHEWMHSYVCTRRGVKILSIYFSTGNESSTEFEKPDDPAIEAEIYLAGVTYDSILLTIVALNSLFYSMWYKDVIPFIFAFSILITALLLYSVPGSDWQKFVALQKLNQKKDKRIATRQG